MTEQKANLLLTHTKSRIQELRSGVSWPSKYPEDVCDNIVQLLAHYSKAEIARGLDLAGSVVERIYRKNLSTKLTSNPIINLHELPTPFVKEEKIVSKIKMELTVNNVQIRIFE